MAHLSPLEYSDINDQEILESIQNYEKARGFVPNSIRTMARRPSIVKAFMALNQSILYDGSVSKDLKMLISLASSLAAGCMYCQSHMANLSSIYNVPDEKIANILDFENSLQFTAAEQADFSLLKKHFSEGQIVEIIATISLFVYLNRWNDTVVTQVEMLPCSVAKRTLPNWEKGKHQYRLKSLEFIVCQL